MTTDAAAIDLGEWAIATAEFEEGTAIFRVRTDTPSEPNADQYTHAVVIRWEYGADENGMPDSVTKEAMDLFEDYTAPLQESGKGFLVLVSTGLELREWVYYAKSTNEFMDAFNGLLAGKPRFPIEITFLDDPQRNYWNDVLSDLHG